MIFVTQLLHFLIQVRFDLGEVEILSGSPAEYVEYIVAGGPEV